MSTTYSGCLSTFELLSNLPTDVSEPPITKYIKTEGKRKQAPKFYDPAPLASKMDTFIGRFCKITTLSDSLKDESLMEAKLTKL
jgi:hypothetical protein